MDLRQTMTINMICFLDIKKKKQKLWGVVTKNTTRKCFITVYCTQILNNTNMKWTSAETSDVFRTR